MIVLDANILIYAYGVGSALYARAKPWVERTLSGAEDDGVLHTTDRDFARFPGLRWTNPLA